MGCGWVGCCVVHVGCDGLEWGRMGWNGSPQRSRKTKKVNQSEMTRNAGMEYDVQPSKGGCYWYYLMRWDGMG